MTEKKNVVILNPFKAGSSTLEEILNKSPHIFSKKFHTYSPEDMKIMPPETVSHVIMIYRDPIDLYISAFFEDITKPEYSYYYGSQEKVLNASPDDLINHFKKFPWPIYGWLNYTYYINTIGDTFEIDKSNIVNFISSQDTHKIINGQYKNNNIVCLLLKTKHLNDSVDVINNVFNVNIKNMEKHRNGENMWYGEKYIQFKKRYNETK